MPAPRTADTIAPADAPVAPAAAAVSGWQAAALYTCLTLALTWPQPLTMSSTIPWDMGDPLLNCWILAWSADHLWRFLTGEWSAFAGYWNANIFHPAPLALAYSEHLFAQAVQILPLWAVTKNPVLCYNVVFLSTFVLSGLGMFLLVRRITGSALAGLVAGAFYAFSPYRIPQFSHVQVLSSQWMPFVLYGMRVYLDTGRRRSLAGATVAWIAQNLSCGYYLIFFSTLLPIYLACELTVRRRWRDWRTLAALAGSGIVTLAATYPFLAPYLELRRIDFPARSLAEVQAYSADLLAYVTVDPRQWVWGPYLYLFPKAEGEAFLGLIPMVLGAIAVAIALRRVFERTPPGPAETGWRRVVIGVVIAGIVLAVFAASAVLLTGGFMWRVGDTRLRVMSLSAVLSRLILLLGLLLVVWPRARARALAFARTETAWYLALMVAAVVLSFGPKIQAQGRTIIPEAPYLWLYAWVPGFDGLRVAARYAMIAALALAALAGIGISHVLRRVSRPLAATMLILVLFVAEAGVAPLPVNPIADARELAPPRRHLFARGGVPAVYRAIATLPADAVIAEFPFGSTAWDVRYVFYSTYHRRSLVNGYSGGLPRQYVATLGALADLRRPDTGWQRLVQAGTTHVVLHTAAYRNDEDRRVEAWLVAHGARRVAAFDTDVLFQLPPR